MNRDFVSFSSWTRDELTDIFSLARKIKLGEMKNFAPLSHKSAALIFEKESLRTRVSFEVGVAQLGGHPLFLQQETIGIATRESGHDVSSVLSRYNELIIARTTKHQTVIQLADSATVPGINAMTDLVHPCQVLGDYFTLQEIGKHSPDTRIVYVGDGNNIANSWLELAEKLPLHLVISSPTGYEPHPGMLEQSGHYHTGRSTLLYGSGSIQVIMPIPEFGLVAYMEKSNQEIFGPLYQKLYLVIPLALLLLSASVGLIAWRIHPLARQLHRSEQLYRTVVDGAADAIILHDRNRRFIETNPATSRMLGYPHNELTGMHPDDFLLPDDRADALKQLERLHDDSAMLNVPGAN